ncbi:MAG: hypothetical protein WC683_06340 [bacterium]
MSKPSLLWISLATSGIKPHVDWPLELGLILTDDQLTELATFHTLFRYTPAYLETIVKRADSFVAQMHQTSGLWLDLYTKGAASGTELPNLPEVLTAWGKQHFGSSVPLLAGFNVGRFDAQWLRVHADPFLELLHFGAFDLSTLRRSVQLLHGDWGPQKPPPARGLEDCRQSIRYWRWYRQHVMTPYHRSVAGGAET